MLTRTRIPTRTDEPSSGLSSDTASSKNAAADEAFLGDVNDIIQGRRPSSELQNLVSAWKCAVGDARRRKHEEQLQTVRANPG